jgi:hypothetical protein
MLHLQRGVGDSGRSWAAFEDVLEGLWSSSWSVQVKHLRLVFRCRAHLYLCHSSPKSHSVIQYSLQRLNAGYGCAVVGLSRDRASVSLSGMRTIIRCKDFMGDLTSAPARELEYLCSFQVTLPCTQPPQFATRWCAHVPYVMLNVQRFVTWRKRGSVPTRLRYFDWFWPLISARGCPVLNLAKLRLDQKLKQLAMACI